MGLEQDTGDDSYATEAVRIIKLVNSAMRRDAQVSIFL